MTFLKWFTFLMKGEPKQKKKRYVWIIDESKCLTSDEVSQLRTYGDNLKIQGLLKGKFSKIRDWFMVELGLETGLRVAEMASLKHGSLYIDEFRSSIVVIGKGCKIRAVWILSSRKNAWSIFNINMISDLTFIQTHIS